MASLFRTAFPFCLVAVIHAVGTWMAYIGATAHDFFHLADAAVGFGAAIDTLESTFSAIRAPCFYVRATEWLNIKTFTIARFNRHQVKLGRKKNLSKGVRVKDAESVLIARGEATGAFSSGFPRWDLNITLGVSLGTPKRTSRASRSLPHRQATFFGSLSDLVPWAITISGRLRNCCQHSALHDGFH